LMGISGVCVGLGHWASVIWTKKQNCTMGFRVTVIVMLSDHWNGVMRLTATFISSASTGRWVLEFCQGWSWKSEMELVLRSYSCKYRQHCHIWRARFASSSTWVELPRVVPCSGCMTMDCGLSSQYYRYGRRQHSPVVKSEIIWTQIELQIFCLLAAWPREHLLIVLCLYESSF
jgi:hypothetical protein